MTLSISILGPLVIESDDWRLGKVPKKARALLAYLAAQGGQAVSRERLADLLWPYQGSEQARHSLRNCLLERRKALGRSAAVHLVADFANCRLQDVVSDLDNFERLSRSQQRSDLRAAADLYRSEFLADFDIDSEPFQEWLAAERDRTLAVVCDVLHRLTAVEDAPGEHEVAIQFGRRLVALDSLSEFGQRALMRAYARAGRRGEALRQYKSCADTLKRELGVAPDLETQALANDIARSGGPRELNPPSLTPVDRDFADFRAMPDQLHGSRTLRQSEESSEEARKQWWPCLLPSISVAVAPLRNLTGDPDQQNLVEAFTDDLITDLLRHGRGLSLKPLQDERGALNNANRTPERGFDYVVTGSTQISAPGLLRVNMRITDAATSEYVWAGRHEFKREDLAPIQIRITRRISRELHLLLLQAASRRAVVDAGIELGVTECLSRASDALAGRTVPELSAEAQRWYLAALARDPRSVEALVGLAYTCQHLVGNPWWGDSRTVALALDRARSGRNRVRDGAGACAGQMHPRDAVVGCGTAGGGGARVRACPRDGPGTRHCPRVCRIQCGSSRSRIRDYAGNRAGHECRSDRSAAQHLVFLWRVRRITAWPYRASDFVAQEILGTEPQLRKRAALSDGGLVARRTPK